jgi:hypothetical protein
MGRDDKQVREGVTDAGGGNVDGTGQLADGRAAAHITAATADGSGKYHSGSLYCKDTDAATMRADDTVTYLHKMLQVVVVIIMGL